MRTVVVAIEKAKVLRATGALGVTARFLRARGLVDVTGSGVAIRGRF